MKEYVLPYFNPRSHEESDELARTNDSATFISIHALMKRATDDSGQIIQIGDISIHALMKRATFFLTPVLYDKTISIHALMKRATKFK